MQFECSWCRKKFEAQSETVNEKEYSGITHGICNDCKNNIAFQLGVSVQEYIDNLKTPVCIIDSQGNVLTANKLVEKALGKDIDNIKGFKGGDVFECAYARLPEGCGNTVHCSGCTIRKNVMATFETGKSLFRVPAKLKKGTIHNIVEVDLLISTEKVGDVVYLRIDEMHA